ncbi:c-type cytochrome [Legionella impletisoli]|uniref:Cytochrome c n=1 Tax=Legionella impletisoli TaxID=343510 RepID=A0A917JWN5_9GAMM|nr:c-type cytochrome [Legionella impletisoli]GGI87537.1 cytochrome c [Legionella impletisoli]
MRKIAFTLFLCCSLLAFAEGNPEAGKEKASVCAACHGPTGVSNNPEWPNLAGQHADYLIKQMKYFKEGKKRSSPLMTPVMADLTIQDMEDLAAFYTAQPRARLTTPKQYVKPGELLYRGGNFEKHITACIACHGPQGLGNAEAGFPVLSGQHAIYNIQQLEAFKSGKRTGDLYDMMHDIANRMGKEDMEAVSYYLSGLH